MQDILKKFNQILNQSDMNRFFDWQDYRNTLTHHLLERINTFKHKPDIIVIGTGNGDDIDLSQLEKHSNRLVLTDIDDLALKRAKEKHQLKISETIAMDYIGFTDNELWNDFLKNIINLEYHEYENYIKEMFHKADFTSLKQYYNQFDYVIVSPIYTQLLLPSFLQQLSYLKDINFPESELEYLKELFLQNISQIINDFNHNIFKLGKPNSAYTIVSDIFETENASHFHEKAKTAYQLNQMDKLLEEYRNDYGYSLGDFGLENAGDYGTIKQHIWLKWPFSKTKILYNKIVDFTK